MRVLVTGAGGYIGPFVCEAMREYGHSIIGADIKEGSLDWATVDLSNLAETRDFLADVRPHAICHLAAVGDVAQAYKYPTAAIYAGPFLTSVLCDAIRCLGEPHPTLMYTSTWEVYGPAQYEPIDEEHPTNPEHFYNIAKLSGEQVALCYHRLYGLPVTVLRLGSAYGPGMRENSVFSVFKRKAQSGETLTVHGDGSQYRQWTHVDDIAWAFYLAITREIAIGKIFNVVSPECVTIRQLAEQIAEKYGVGVSFGEPRPGDVSPAVVSAEKAARVLGWRAIEPFADKLEELLDD